jgi:hypothetical protein
VGDEDALEIDKTQASLRHARANAVAAVHQIDGRVDDDSSGNAASVERILMGPQERSSGSAESYHLHSLMEVLCHGAPLLVSWCVPSGAGLER